jgi:hypothetical protein
MKDKTYVGVTQSRQGSGQFDSTSYRQDESRNNGFCEPRRQRRKSVSVRRGKLIGQGVHKTAAKNDLDGQIDWLLEQSGVTVEVRFGHGIVVAVNPAAAVYEYTIIWLDDLSQHGKAKAGTVCLGKVDRNQAVQAARYTCENCHDRKMAEFQPDVLTDPSYWTDGPSMWIDQQNWSCLSRDEL